METVTLKFRADGQQLSVVSGPRRYAANTVAYVRAEFELGDNWTGFDSVRAVWANDFSKVATVLDFDGACLVPWEVLRRTDSLWVNLVGSISDGDELTDRLTTYKVKALDVNGCTNVDGDNTQPITPSQFEQFVAVVHDDAEAAADARDEARGYASDAEEYKDDAVGAAADAKDYRDAAKGYADDAEGYKDQAKGYADEAEADAEEIRNMTATATTLPEGSSATASYLDGVLSLGIPKGDTGATGATGNGIASAVLNADYTLTLNFTDGTHYTTPPIRGAQGVQGETGNGIDRIEKTETAGSVDTYTIYFTDGTTTTFTVTNGEVTKAELETLLPTKSASSSIVSFPDGQSMFPMESLKVNLEPIQDLHGYDSPWVGGAGKNKIDPSTVTLYGGGTAFGMTFSWDSTKGCIKINGTFTGASGNVGFRTIIVSGDIRSYNVKGFSTSSNFNYLRWQNGEDSIVAELVNLVQNTTYNIEIYPIVYDGTEPTSWTPYSNICPIYGHDSVGAVRTGKNLFNKESVQNIITDYDYRSGAYACDYIQLVPNTTVTVSFNAGATSTAIILMHNKEQVNDNGYLDLRTASGSKTFTTDANGRLYIGCLVAETDVSYNARINACNIQIELGSTATDYEPYEGDTYTADLPQTVYGGWVDLVTGEGEIDRATTTLGALNWDMSGGRFYSSSLNATIKKGNATSGYDNIMGDCYASQNASSLGQLNDCSMSVDSGGNVQLRDDRYTSKTELVNAMSSAQLCYKLATPIPFNIDPQVISTLYGTNNVWSKQGDVDVTYKADIQLYIDKKTNELAVAIAAL